MPQARRWNELFSGLSVSVVSILTSALLAFRVSEIFGHLAIEHRLDGLLVHLSHHLLEIGLRELQGMLFFYLERYPYPTPLFQERHMLTPT